MIIKKFEVDGAEYESAGHVCALITEEYICGSARLTRQMVHEELMSQIIRELRFGEELGFCGERYFYTGPERQEKRELTRPAFLDKQRELLEKGGIRTEERCERYDYRDKNGRPARAWITLFREGDAPMQAEIGFHTADELEAFVPPRWLRPADHL